MRATVEQTEDVQLKTDFQQTAYLALCFQSSMSFSFPLILLLHCTFGLKADDNRRADLTLGWWLWGEVLAPSMTSQMAVSQNFQWVVQAKMRKGWIFP